MKLFKYNRLICSMILFLSAIGLNTWLVFDDLDMMRLESTFEVSSLRSSKSTIIVQLEHDFERFSLQQPIYQPNYQANRILASPVSIACVFSPGGLGDKSYNDMAYAGLQKAQSDGLCTFEYAEPANVIEGNDSLKAYALNGTYDLIIAVGFFYEDPVNTTAQLYPNQAILNIDTAVTQGNVSSTIFKYHEGSFLVGALAGLMTNTGRIGFIGGMDVPFIREFWAGYAAGAFYEKNNSYIEVFDDYVGSWSDNVTAKSQAENMWEKGVDIIFTAAGESGLGVMEFASETPGVYAIGADADQDYMYPGDILTSMMKRIDIAVYRGIQNVYNETWSNNTNYLGLTEDGVGLSPMHYTKDLIGQKIIEEVNVTVRNKIIGGAFTVPKNTSELGQWMTTMKIVNKSYTYNASFSITSDTQFGPSGYDFPGSGSPADPYNITGLYVNATSGTLISISDTTSYFRIDNCLLNGLNTTIRGIDLQNVQNGMIVNTTLWNLASDGIRLGDPSPSHNNTIVDNIVSNIDGNGIFLYSSTNNVIMNNTVFNNTFKGIRLEYSNDNNISDNIVYDNAEDGIFFKGSDNCYINGNTIYRSNRNGIHLEYTNNSWVSENIAFENGQSGISSEYAENNTILSNEVYNNSWMGFTSLYSKNHMVKFTIAQENEADGISFYFSTNNTIINNTASNNQINGIRLESLVSNCTIINNTILGNNEDGIRIGYASKNNNVSFNLIFNNSEGILLTSDTNDNYIGNNTIFNNTLSGIRLSNESRLNTCTKNIIFNNGGEGVEIEDSNDNNITFNTIYYNKNTGILLMNSSYGYLSHNIVYNNVFNGIMLIVFSDRNIILNNAVYDNRGGILCANSGNNTISKNKITSNNYYGLIFWNTKNNTIEANELTNAGVYWGSPVPLTQKVVANNLINGRPLIFWENIHGGVVPAGSGQVILVNCTDISITGQNFSRSSSGVIIAFCARVTIYDNLFDNTSRGIDLADSNDSLIENNSIMNFLVGILLGSSNRNELKNNNISNGENGITLIGASDNVISYNFIFEHDSYGVTLVNTSDHVISSGNTFLFNDFTNNNIGGSQALDDGSTNIFQYNYWNDWNTPDISPADGVVDAAYSIDGTADNYDLFPLASSAPIIIIPPVHISYHELSTGNNLSWTVIDPYPSTYSIWRNNVLIVSDVLWLNGTPITILIDGLASGAYNFTAVFKDSNGNFTRDEVWVTVLANTAPDVTVNYPNGGEILSGEISITWNASDDHEDLLAYFVYYWNGNIWIEIADNITETTYRWNTRNVVDRSDYLVKINASDGFLMGGDESDNTFTINNDPILILAFVIIVPATVIVVFIYRRARSQIKRKKVRKANIDLGIIEDIVSD